MKTNDPKPVVTDRSKAIQWWNTLTTFEKMDFCYKRISNTRNYNSLTGREIETIWVWFNSF